MTGLAAALARRRWLPEAGRVLLILTGLAVFLFPVYWTVTMALKPQAEWTPTGDEIFWVPRDPTLGNFPRLFGETTTADFLADTPIDATDPIVNSLVASVFGTLLALTVGTATAYGESRSPEEALSGSAVTVMSTSGANALVQCGAGRSHCRQPEGPV